MTRARPETIEDWVEPMFEGDFVTVGEVKEMVR